MGDRNQIIFGSRFIDSFKPPFLEVGSMEYGNTSTFRRIINCQEGQYIGIDVSPGKGVDRVVDLTHDFATVTKVLPEKFNTIICLSVLEHCANPFKMAQNIEKLLNPGGYLYISVPFCWGIHNYPSDYWRFTPNGVRTLFLKINFIKNQSVFHSTPIGVFYPISEPPPKIEFYFSEARQHYGLFYAFWISFIRKIGIVKPIFLHSYIYPPVMVDMIGKKIEDR